MSVSSLIEKTAKAHVSNANLGASAPVHYFHRDGTDETVNAFIGSIDSSDENRTGERYDEAIFLQMDLSTAPRAFGDYIEYLGETYIVERFHEKSGLFSVICTKDKSKKASRK